MTMREILFRGKRIDNGEWVEGYYIRTKRHHCIITGCINDGYVVYGHYANDVAMDVVDLSTIGQYTGLQDKNGNRIFEGDIIKIPDDYEEFGHNAGEVYEVYFAFGGFRLKPKYSKARGYWLEDDATIEVIGNIHDNPELLKGE